MHAVINNTHKQANALTKTHTSVTSGPVNRGRSEGFADGKLSAKESNGSTAGTCVTA